MAADCALILQCYRFARDKLYGNTGRKLFQVVMKLMAECFVSFFLSLLNYFNTSSHVASNETYIWDSKKSLNQLKYKRFKHEAQCG